MSRRKIIFCRQFLIGMMMAFVVGCSAPTTKQSTLDPELVRQEEERQMQLAIKKDYEYSQRLRRVSWPVLAAAAPLCEGNTAPRYGIQYSNIYTYRKEFRPAAAAVLQLDDSIKVISVTPGSSGEAAGVQVGDVIVAVNGHKVPSGEKAVEKTSKFIANAVEDDPTLTLRLLRDGEEINLDVPGQTMCRFAAQLHSSDEINAFADGNGIYITRGMMRFASDDNQLAIVVAHELAHNSQEHIKAKTKNYLLGSILDLAAAAAGVNTQGAFGSAAAGAYSQEFEAEADYVGLYALALADVDYSQAADFWREMGVENPGSITRGYASSHPSTAERFIALENTAAEIKRKKQDGLELKPELKQ